MTNKKLSPASQAVLDAFNNRGLSSREWHDGKAASLKLAAALRAVAAIPSASAPVPFTYKLLDIADELEAL
jgi:hypothetical protein